MSNVILKEVHTFLLNYKINENTHKEIMLFLFNSIVDNLKDHFNIPNIKSYSSIYTEENIIVNGKFGIIKSKRGVITLKFIDKNNNLHMYDTNKILKYYIIFDEFENQVYKLQLSILLHKDINKKPYIHSLFKMTSGFKKKETITGKRYCTLKFNKQQSKYLSYQNLYKESTIKNYYKLKIIKDLSNLIQFFIPLFYNYDPYKIILEDLSTTTKNIFNYYIVDYFLIRSFTIPPKYFSNVTKYLIKKYKFSRLNIGQLVVASISCKKDFKQIFNYDKIEVNEYIKTIIQNKYWHATTDVYEKHNTLIYFETKIRFSYYLNVLMKNFILKDLIFNNLKNYILLFQRYNTILILYKKFSYSSILYDTLLMLNNLQSKVRMLKPKITSPNAFQEQHDKIMVEHKIFLNNYSEKLKKQNNKKFKIKKKYDPILDNINFYNIKTLQTKTDIIDLGNDQNHCIATYINDFIKGDLLLLVGIDNEETCTTTIEFNDSHRKFQHCQSRLKYNKSPSKEYMNTIDLLINKSNIIINN